MSTLIPAGLILVCRQHEKYELVINYIVFYFHGINLAPFKTKLHK